MDKYLPVFDTFCRVYQLIEDKDQLETVLLVRNNVISTEFEAISGIPFF